MVRLRWILLPVLVACLYKVMSPEASIWADDDALFLGSAPSHQVRCKRNLHSYSYALADGHGYNTILLDVDDSVGTPVLGYGLLDDRDMYNNLYAGAYGKEAESINEEHLLSASNGVSQSGVVGVPEGGVIPPNNGVSQSDVVGVPEGGVIPPNNGVSHSDVAGVSEGGVIPPNNGVSQSDVVGVPEGGVIPPNNGVSQSDVVGVPEGGVLPPNNGVSQSGVVGVPEAGVIPPNNGVSQSDVVGVPEAGVIPPNNGVSTNETSDVVGVPEGGVIPPNNEVPADNSTSPSGSSPTQQETSGTGGEKVKCEDDSSTFSEDASCGITGASNLGTSNSNSDVEQAASAVTAQTNTLGENQGNDRQNGETSELNVGREVNTLTTEGGIGDNMEGANIAGGESPNMVTDGGNSTDENQQTGSVNEATGGTETNREVNEESTVDGVTGEQTAQSVSDVAGATSVDKPGVVDNIQGAELVPTEAGSTGVIAVSAVDTGLENNASGTEIADKADVDQLSNKPSQIETTNGTSEVNNEETNSGLNKDIEDGVERKDGDSTVGETISGTEGANNQGSAVLDEAQPDPAAIQRGDTGNAPTANEGQTDDIAGTTTISGVQAADSIGVGSLKQDVGDEQARETLGANEGNVAQAEAVETKSAGIDQLPSENDGKETDPSEAVGAKVEDGSPAVSASEQTETRRGEQGEDIKTVGLNEGEEATKVDDSAGNVALPVNNETGEQQPTGAEITSVVPQQSVTSGDTTGEQQPTGAEITSVGPQQSVTGGDTTGEQQPTGAEITSVGPQQSVTSGDTTGEQQPTGAEITSVVPQQSVTGGDTTGEQQPTGAEITSVGPQQSVAGGDTTGEQQPTGAEITSVVPQQSVTGGDTTGEQQPTGAEITSVGPQQSVTGGDTTGEQQPTGAEITSVSPQQSVTGGDTTGEQQPTGAEITSVSPQQSVMGGDTTGEQQPTGAEITSVGPQQSVAGGDTTGEQQPTGVEITSVGPQQSVAGGDTTGEQQPTGVEITSVSPQQSVAGGDTTGEQQPTGAEITSAVPQQSVTGGDTTGEKQPTVAEITSVVPQQSVTGGDTTGEQQSTGAEITSVGPQQSVTGGDTTGEQQSTGAEITSVGPQQSVTGGDTTGEQQSVSNKDGEVNVGNPEETSLNQMATAVGETPSEVGNDGIVEVPGDQKDGETNVGNLAQGDQNQTPGSEIVSEVRSEVSAGNNGEREKETVSNVNVGNPAESSLNQVPGDSGTANNLQSEGTLEKGQTAEEASGSNNEENAPTRVSLDLPVEDTAGEASSGKPPVGETTNQETGNIESVGADQVTTLNNASVDGAQIPGQSEEGVGKVDQKTADGEERSGIKQGGETEVLAQGERNNELQEASQISESSRNPSERTNIETIDENYKQSVSKDVKEPLEGGSETQTGKEINISSQNDETEGKEEKSGNKEDSVAVPIAENSVTGVQQELKEAGKVDNVEKLRKDVEIVPVGETGGVSGKLLSAGDERLPAELVVILNEYRRRAEANRKNAAAQLINNFNGAAMAPVTGTGAGVECGCAEDNLVDSDCGECCGQDDCCGCDEYHYDFAGLPPLCPLCQQEFYSMMVGQHNPYATMPPIDFTPGRMCKRHRNAKQKKNAQLSPYMRKVLRALSYNSNNVYQQEVYKPFAYEKKGRKTAIRGPLPYIIERYFSVYGKTKPIPHKSVKMLYYNQKNGNRPKVFKLDKLQNT